MNIRKADSLADLKAVWELTYQTYLNEGYVETRAHHMLAHYPHLDVLSETTIYLAESDQGQLLGTVSHTDDGPGGLQVDSDFRDIVDSIRTECSCDGLRLGSPWRMATQINARGSHRVFMALLGRLTAHLKENKVEVCLFTFNPKHVSFYQKIWGLTVLAQRDAHAVQDAPGVLMRGDLPTMISNWDRRTARRQTRVNTRMEAVLA